MNTNVITRLKVNLSYTPTLNEASNPMGEYVCRSNKKRIMSDLFRTMAQTVFTDKRENDNSTFCTAEILQNCLNVQDHKV